jgi:hypothetical protein
MIQLISRAGNLSCARLVERSGLADAATPIAALPRLRKKPRRLIRGFPFISFSLASP